MESESGRVYSEWQENRKRYSRMKEEGFRRVTGVTESIDNGDNGGISEWSQIAFDSGEGAGIGTTGVPEGSTNGVVKLSVEVGARGQWTCGETTGVPEGSPMM